MFTIGISFGYHDSSVTILSENHICGVYQEERFSRKKHDNRFPENALKYALHHHKITKESIKIVSYYEDTVLKQLRIRERFDVGRRFLADLLQESSRAYKISQKNLLLSIWRSQNQKS